MADTSGLNDVIIIKKYANRRLYDTSSSSYVTLEHLSTLVREGKDFVVQDAKSGEDLTRSVLAQIIFEQENKGGNALPLNFLRQVIRFYGDSVSSALPTYLDMAMNNFTKNQERWRDMMAGGSVGPNPMGLFEEQARRNFEMFERSMNLFTAGTPARSRPEAEDEAPPKKAQRADKDEEADTIDALQRQMAEMQAQLSKLSKK
ncbi:polyhydroxyalkanoate synthesis repressor PhaR [Ponticaulis sp.]|uniref:polyhydroxyalkanoate synthesis repressor PhaR n=1 Tax=Ponticaulis sp. TaxID=2020902 RepID=UPI000B693F62|nr:polyhydroxyalkanoate synthesis repressor PhaR [Ponticaulis sp.]MAJ07834.1 polyhydroxyalkanoate synthesis repressor PhaR [Ponticaulis sp.]MDF1679515.1 polyhydroxyalkanoate synthesis repressor PhaR [Ponticaulis sp.]RPG18151.1 MAG: polyhydroxyalkanoate synthesis repressor PhaR [Hyphomonadaceae bacterium TMED125]HBJ93047.1 polyhydroxyalkanoate synthesis repressor PhaR [Hyphomonadaceae bacterium]|tara:strand:- start:406 stop:1014 length:609 start_codon:yes stop_codon:yes gene_type:complete